MQQPGPQPHDVEEHVRIGDLLTEAGIVTRGDVVESIQISKRMNLPIGRVLVMSGVLTELLLTAALQVQEMLKENKLTMEQAHEVLNHVHTHQCSLDAAMEAVDCKPTTDFSRSKLGLLLVDSDIVTPEQVEEALAASFGSGIPLGSMLVLQGMLSAQLLPGILDAQERLRAGRINHIDAVAEIRTQFDYWAHANDSKNNTELLTLGEQGSAPGTVAPPSGGSRVASTASNRDYSSSKDSGGKKKGGSSSSKKDATGTYPQLVISGEHPAAATGQHKSIASETGNKHKAISETGKHKAVSEPAGHGAAAGGKYAKPISASKPTAEVGKTKPTDSQKLKALSDSESSDETGSYGAISGTYGSVGGGSRSSRRKRSTDRPPIISSRKPAYVQVLTDPEDFHLENNEDLSMLSLLEMSGFGNRDVMLEGVKSAFKDAETTVRLARVLGVINKKHLDAAVLCYTLVSQWKLTIPEAVGVLAEVRVSEQSVEDVLAKHNLAEDDEDD